MADLVLVFKCSSLLKFSTIKNMDSLSDCGSRLGGMMTVKAPDDITGSSRSNSQRRTRRTEDQLE